MKKILLVFMALVTLCCLVGCVGATGENITGITTTDNMVWFEPECPECGHIGFTKSVNICDGEDYEGIHQCESCGEIFDISVVR